MKKIYAIISLALAFSAVSCNKNEIWDRNYDMGILNMDMNIDPVTRAVENEDQLRSNAVVNIYKGDFSGLVRTYKYSAMPSTCYLRAIDCGYRVDVIAGEAVAESPAAASWTSKSYKGSEPFTITAGQTTDVQVKATVSNAVTEISFDQTVADNFKAGYTLSIGLDDEDAATSLVYDASKSGAEGYFIIDDIDEPSFSWSFNGTLAKDDSQLTKTGVIENIEAGKLYKLNLVYTIKDGDLDFALYVDTETVIYDDIIIFEPVSTGLASSAPYEIWAKRATVHADVDPTENAGATVAFEYSSNGADWTKVAGVDGNDGTWSADITGLTPETEYTYRLLINDEVVGESKTLTTDIAPNLPNASLEYVSLVTESAGTDKPYYKFYDPGCDVEDGSYMFWGSGNGEGSEGVKGSASMGIIITDIDTADKIDGNQSVVGQNSSMVGLLTAGNLFTGQFAGLVGTEGGKVNFGRPWKSRPSALKLYCKYKSGKINILKNENLGVSTSDYDRAQIKFAIGNWSYKQYGGTKDSPVLVNTTDESTFVDFYTDESTIANGDLIIYNDGYSINKAAKVEATTSGWIEYTIPLNYRNLTTFPTHIIISCATSQFGDYFTGYDQGKLWLDKFELIYE